MTQILRHKDILIAGAQSHLTRATLTTARPRTLHGHDFFELVWVQNGKIRHHLEGKVVTLTEGDVVFIQPGQTHALQGRG